jgi:hypothetical protein
VNFVNCNAQEEVSRDNLNRIFRNARRGRLSKRFTRWTLVNRHGDTVAHVAARYGHLPEDFNQWAITRPGRDGLTVAHVAASKGHLPEGFNQWSLACELSGHTVAHAAARRGRLPVGFRRWALADKRGWTVAHELAMAGWRFPHLFQFWDEDRIWDMHDMKGRTVREIYDAYARMWTSSNKAEDKVLQKP